jgi:hypothetical protein
VGAGDIAGRLLHHGWGDGYERVLASVRLPDGRVEDAYVYVLRDEPGHANTNGTG